MDKHPVSAWDYALERKLNEQIAAMTEALASGTATDYAGYQHLCGTIRGIQFAMDALIQVREKFHLEDNTDWQTVGEK